MTDFYDDHEFTEDMADHDEAAAEDRVSSYEGYLRRYFPLMSEAEIEAALDFAERMEGKQTWIRDPWSHEAAAEDAAQDRIDSRLPAHSPEDLLITVDGDGRTIARQAATGDPWTYVRDLRSMPDAELQAQIAESKANTVAQNIAAQDKERHETAARLANNQYPEGA